MKGLCRLLLILCFALVVYLAPGVVAAQEADLTLTEQEVAAWQTTQIERYISAREISQEVLGANPRSIVAHTTLGMIQRHGEGNLPRALYHLRRARSLLEERFGEQPTGPTAVEWHRRILQETAYTAAEMERFDEELDIWDLYDRLYDPDVPGERIWPLLMQRRFADARRWAAKALATGERWPRRQALNGMCAIESEAGNRSSSYRWCTSHAREVQEIGGFGAVYFCNAGESARGLFRLDEAERLYLEATRRDVEWYANPWMDLATLYTRAGRLAPAARAVRSMHEYTERRPSHTQQQDQSERHRAVAALLIVAGRPERALPFTERAVLYPDRRGGQSRTPEADLATNALLDRRALLDAAQVTLERASTGSLWDRWWAAWSATWLRVKAFRSGRRVVALMEDEELLRGLLEAEGHSSFGTQPWLAADLIEVVGPGPVEAALAAARAEAPEEIPELLSYLDAYDAEAHAARGDWPEAVELAGRAREGLPPGEALLRARMQLILALAHESQANPERAVALYLELLQIDPTLIRRTGTRLPARIVSAQDRLSRRTAALLARSPRLRPDATAQLVVQVQAEGGSTCHLCLATAGGATAGCVTETVEEGTDFEDTARQCADLFHEQLLAPQVDMSLFDSSSLDGSTGTGSVDDILTGTTPGDRSP